MTSDEPYSPPPALGRHDDKGQSVARVDAADAISVLYSTLLGREAHDDEIRQLAIVDNTCVSRPPSAILMKYCATCQ